jgi:hypothetical protein
MLALKLAQKGEQHRDLARIVFVDAMEAYKRVE